MVEILALALLAFGLLLNALWSLSLRRRLARLAAPDEALRELVGALDRAVDRAAETVAGLREEARRLDEAARRQRLGLERRQTELARLCRNAERLLWRLGREVERARPRAAESGRMSLTAAPADHAPFARPLTAAPADDGTAARPRPEPQAKGREQLVQLLARLR